jgi:hypothetical protein
MEKLAFTRACLSNVKVIIAMMCVPLVELLCEMTMGQIPALEYLLSDARELLLPHRVTPGCKCHCFPRP